MSQPRQPSLSWAVWTASRSKEGIIPVYSTFCILYIGAPKDREDIHKMRQVQWKVTKKFEDGALPLWGESDGLGFVKPVEGKTLGSTTAASLKKRVPRRPRGTLYSDIWWEDKRKWRKLKRDILTGYKETNANEAFEWAAQTGCASPSFQALNSLV